MLVQCVLSHYNMYDSPWNPHTAHPFTKWGLVRLSVSVTNHLYEPCFNYPNPRYISLADAAWKHPKYPCFCILPLQFEGNIEIHKHKNSEVIYLYCNWLSLQRLVSWINHLPPACWSTFWKSIFKQQLGCKFDIIDSTSYFFFILTYAIIYVLIHHIIFWLYLYFLNILYFFKYSCANIFHRRSFCTFYPKEMSRNSRLLKHGKHVNIFHLTKCTG